MPPKTAGVSAHPCTFFGCRAPFFDRCSPHAERTVMPGPLPGLASGASVFTAARGEYL
jgi:hypothetical protein